MPNQFFSPEGDLENYFVTEYWLIDQYVGDELWTWGSGLDGRLGNGATTGGISTPITTFAGGTNWKQVSCGSRHMSAIKTDGTLWTWGYGGNGRLGNGLITGSRSTPITTFAGGTNWKQVSAGSDSTSAIKTDGTLWTWGAGSGGKLGNGATTGSISTPITTFAGGSNWKQVSSLTHTVAIKTDGTLWTWGYSGNGRLGNAVITTNASTPITTFAGGNNWKQVNAGTNHTAAVKTDGTLWIWGSPNYGRLGILGLSGIRSTPVTTFAGGTNWKQVTCNDRHTVAVKTDGTLWTWGYTSGGILGNGISSAGNRATPVTTFSGGTNWKQVDCGPQHTAATKTDGTLWTWGTGGSGKLGNAQITNGSTPVTTFAGGTNWKQVSANGTHMVAVFSGTTPDLPIS